MSFLDLEIREWLVITATLLGPLFAVQAQKWIEGYRERRSRKIRLFEQLMASRAARVSEEHVRALNMIDLVFYGERLFGMQRRTTKEQRVIDAWKEYLDHLNNRAEEEAIPLWVTQSDELFINLLFAIAQDLGYSFDRVHLKRGAYSPKAHGELESEQAELRRATLSLITGKHALKMDVVGFPIDEEALAANKAAIQTVGRALETGVLRVEVKPSA